LTLGDGTSVATYARDGRTIHFRWKFTLGSTSAVGTNPEFTLPVAMAGAPGIADTPAAVVSFLDANVPDVYPGMLLPLSTTNMRIRRVRADLTNATSADCSSTTPFTWTTSDVIYCAGTYEAAS
jgi:hypothetical protein